MPFLDVSSKQNYRCRTDFDHPLSMQRAGCAKRLSRSGHYPPRIRLISHAAIIEWY